MTRTYRFSIAAGLLDGGLNGGRLISELNAALAPLTATTEITGDDLVVVVESDDLTVEQQAALRAVVAVHRDDAHHLPAVQAAAFARIDAKTDEIIARGFEFRGKRFSSSLESQTRTLGMDQLRNDPVLTYPITYNTKDDDDAITLDGPDDVHAFFLTGLSYYRSAIDSGSALKAAVRAATTVEEALAVVDERP